MPTAEELLMQNAEVGDISEETWPYITVDMESRKIVIPPTITNIGVTSDDDVKRLWFKIDRYYHDCDLSTFLIRINYLNAEGDGDVYTPEDIVIEDDYLIFSWLIGRYAVYAKGVVKFIICLLDMSEHGVVDREFNTTIASLPVLEGLETVPMLTEDQIDAVYYAARHGATEALREAKESGEFTGEPGKTPEKGVDYWTPNDEAAMVADTLDNMRSGKLVCAYPEPMDISWYPANLQATTGVLSNIGTGSMIVTSDFIKSGFQTSAFIRNLDESDDKVELNYMRVYRYPIGSAENASGTRLMNTTKSWSFAFPDGYWYRIAFTIIESKTAADVLASLNGNPIDIYDLQNRNTTFTLVPDVPLVPDCCNSWWCNPKTYYDDRRDILYATGVSACGTSGIVSYDRRHNIKEFIPLGPGTQDDHNTPALLAGKIDRPISAYTDHSKYPYINVRVGSGSADVSTIKLVEDQKVWFIDEAEQAAWEAGSKEWGGCTYASLIRRPRKDRNGATVSDGKTIALLTRMAYNNPNDESKNMNGIWCRVSRDNGETWEPPFRLSEHLYYMDLYHHSEHDVRGVLCTHAITVATSQIKMFKIDLDTGDVYVVSPSGNVTIANLWFNQEERSFMNSDYIDDGGNPTKYVDTLGETVVEDNSVTYRTLDVGFGDSVLVTKMLGDRFAVRKNSNISGGFEFITNANGDKYPISMNDSERDVVDGKYVLHKDGTKFYIMDGDTRVDVDAAYHDFVTYGGEYGVFTRESNGTWSYTAICNTGRAVGYCSSAYVGGACFEDDSDRSVLVCREDNRVWYFERWTYFSDKYLCRNVYDIAYEDGDGLYKKLGRPQRIGGLNDDNNRFAVCVNYIEYPEDSYINAYGDIKFYDLNKLEGFDS